MESVERGRFWTLSNMVSLLRVVLILPAVWLIALGADRVWEAFGVVAVMIVSDWIDGWLARRWGEISQWGKILDPLADKVAVGAITIAMVVFKGLPVWLVVVVLLRDVVIFFAGMYLVKRHDVLLSSNFWGKVTTLVLSGLLLAYLWDADVLKPALIGLSIAFLAVSLISYGRQFFDVIKK